MNNEIINAKITATMLGKEPHNIFTCSLCIEWSYCGCWYGDYALDMPNKEKRKREGTAIGMSAIMELLNTLDINTWEELKGQYIRIELENNRIVRIGHLLENKWFSFKEFFENNK